MGNIIGRWTGANAAKGAQQFADAMATQSQQLAQQTVSGAQQQEAQAQADQGQQLALLAGQQAKQDLAAANVNAPSIGRAIMGYVRRTSSTLGG